MSIKIGERTLATARRADLDAALVTATGCNLGEHAAMLTNHPTPVGIAAALQPFLTDQGAPSQAELAAAIGELAVEDQVALRGEVVDLLREAVDPTPAPSPELSLPA